ncbi:MAG: YeeE/YedE family protein [Ideonella sp.]|nr:YeeE/YedE family protein [Ideonella sp.]
MSLPLSPESASSAVLWGGLVLGLLLGAAAQATRFCTMGGLSDWFVYQGTPRLMMWVLAVAVAAAVSMGLVLGGVLDVSRTVPWGDRLLWLSYLLGGTVFGAGMVIASGCPQRNLVRLGSGSLKALVTLMVIAVSAQMTLRGLFAEGRARFLDTQALQLAGPQDLGYLLSALGGLSAMQWRGVVLALLLLVAASLLWRYRREMETGHWVGGLSVGLLVSAAWVLTGLVGYLPEHPDTLEPAWLGTATKRPEALSFTAPVAHSIDLLTFWSDRNTTVSFGVLLSLGVVLGAAVSAKLRGEFRVEGFKDVADLRGHLLGGVMMGFGGVTAMGCSIGQGVSGLSLLSGGAVLAVAGIVLGVWGALKWQMRGL